MGDADDLALLDRWCGGDSSAGNELFRRHYEAIYRFFRNKSEGDCADLVQETFLACVESRSRFRRTSSFRTYLFAIARNTMHSHWRKRSTAAAAVDFDEISVASLSTSAATRIDRSDDRTRLLAALRDLPVEMQLMLELHYWEGLDSEQLADVFDIAPATTRSRLFRARDALRDRLAQVSTERRGAPIHDVDLDAWAIALRPNDDDVRNEMPARTTTEGGGPS